jgi:nucleoid DNA-binding protein
LSYKIEFINRIYNKFDGEIPVKVIEDVLKISLNHIIDEVKAGRQYSIDGLGMFSLVYFSNKKKVFI